jgi:hypothetical protein
VWNSTAPTAAVFTVGTAGGTNAAGGTYVAYLFAEVPGFSRIDKYTGNGAAEGPFVWCGFRPKWVLFKSGNAVNWFVRDTARNPSNPTNYSLYPNLADAEYTAATAVDLLSNGFKVRDGSAGTNGSGENIIYAAFADTPFKTARAR